MAETAQKKITLNNFFEQIVEINKVSQKALKKSDESLSVSEKTKIDLERLIQLLKVDFTKEVEKSKSESGKEITNIIREDATEDRELKDSFLELQSSFRDLSSAIGIMRKDLDSLSSAFLQMQQGRRRALKQQGREISKEEDTLQKEQILGTKDKGGDTRQVQDQKRQQEQKENKALSALKGLLGGGLLTGLGMAFGGGDSNDDPGFKNNDPVPDISNDKDFIEEVHKLSKETGTKPSELMGFYNAESSGINTRAKNSSGATGIFQLMFNPNDPNDKRYGYTREQFANLSRGDQVRAHRQYLKETGFFKKNASGIADVKMANIAPAFLGESPDTPIYRQGTQAYEGNKNIDLIYGNSDGIITGAEYMNFVNQTGNEEEFRKYNDPSVLKGTQLEPEPETQVEPKSEPSLQSSITPQKRERVPDLQKPSASIASVTLPPIEGQTQQIGGGQGRGQASTNSYGVKSTTNSMMFAQVLSGGFSDKMNIAVG